MGFMQKGINGKPLKRQGNRKLEFSEFGIVAKKPEPEKSDANRALEFAKRLPRREKVDHEALIQNFGTVIQSDSKELDANRALEFEKSLRGKHELDHEALVRDFGR